MRYLIVSDIHANLEAFDATLVAADLATYKIEYERLLLELETARDRSTLREEAEGRDELESLLLRLRMRESN